MYVGTGNWLVPLPRRILQSRSRIICVRIKNQNWAPKVRPRIRRPRLADQIVLKIEVGVRGRIDLFDFQTDTDFCSRCGAMDRVGFDGNGAILQTSEVFEVSQKVKTG